MISRQERWQEELFVTGPLSSLIPDVLSFNNTLQLVPLLLTANTFGFRSPDK